MINSPAKRQIANRAGHLDPIIQRQREVIGCGAQSLVLANGHNQVYTVTRTTIAQNIELLREVPEDPNLFSIPKVVGINQDLAKLISPDAPEKTKKRISKIYEINPPQLWVSNIVYELPRYDGTLEDLKKIRFNEASIKTLQETLQSALTLLHDHGLSHNDISLRNVFYKGQLPHLKFFLGDFGSLTKNTEANHETKCGKDLMRLQRVIDKAKEILASKEKYTNKKKQIIRSLLPQFNHSREEAPQTPEELLVDVFATLKKDSPPQNSVERRSRKKLNFQGAL